jgi:RNA polymerase sigma factor (sigma-70 family)
MYSNRPSEVHEMATKLYSKERDYLLSIARRNAHTEQDAAEALQEAFIAFIAHFDPAKESPPLAWLTLTLKRQCWAQKRKAHTERFVDEGTLRFDDDRERLIEMVASSEAGPDERVTGLEEGRERLAGLKPDERTALGMFGAGCSYAEIAEVRGWTYTKVNRCIAEGRAALREP